MRIVELDGNFLRKDMPVSVASPEAVDEYSTSPVTRYLGRAWVVLHWPLLHWPALQSRANGFYQATTIYVGYWVSIAVGAALLFWLVRTWRVRKHTTHVA